MIDPIIPRIMASCLCSLRHIMLFVHREKPCDFFVVEFPACGQSVNFSRVGCEHVAGTSVCLERLVEGHINTFSTTEWGPCPPNSTFVVLKNTAQTERSFKTNYLLMKGENSITHCCIVLTYKSVKIWWLVKKKLVFWSIWYRFFVDDDSNIRLMSRTMDGSWF